MFLRHHRRHGRWALALASSMLLVSACAGGDDDAGSSAAPSSSAPPTTAARTTTSSSSTTSTSTSTSTLPATTTTTTELATTTTVAPAPVWPLTGVPLDDPAAAAHPALVVKIDNAPAARPQTGFNAADIVYEEIVNDNLTRFAMVFHSGGSNPVGPIRSGRIQDIDLFGSLNHPLFAWSGGNKTVTAAIRASDLLDIGPSRAGAYFRGGGRRAPHNLYSNTNDLFAQAPADQPTPGPQFVWRSPGEPATGAPSQGAVIQLDSITARWTWDPASGLYTREMEGGPHLDAAGGQVTTHNVVVLVMEYGSGISGSPDAHSVGANEALVFTGGTYIHGTWNRPDRLGPFVLLDDNGAPIRLTPGRTFIELPKAGNTAGF